MAMTFKQYDKGEKPPRINAPCDVKTVYSDGIGNISMSSATMIFGFLERVGGPDGLPVERYVINIALSMAELESTHKMLGDVIEDLKARMASGELN